MALVFQILISNANCTENSNENRHDFTTGLPADYFPLVNIRDSAIDPRDWLENNRTLNSGVQAILQK